MLSLEDNVKPKKIKFRVVISRKPKRFSIAKFVKDVQMD